jgi:hypothetical protein
MENVEIWRKMAQYRGFSSRQICPGIAEVSRSADSSPAAIYAGRVRACNLGARRKDISATLVSADNVESARRAHHLQNPQNRPWYRVCNRLADRPLGEMGESGWKPNGQRHHGRVPTKQGGRADNSCGHLARCVQPNRPSSPSSERLRVLRVLKVQATR